MPRALLILLFGLCLFPTFAPLLALVGGTADAQSALPACCRRLGAHHCAMLPRLAGSEGNAEQTREHTVTSPPEPCPFRTAVFAPAPGPTLTPAPATSPGRIAAAPSHPRSPAQAFACRRLARERARHKRGPPALLS